MQTLTREIHDYAMAIGVQVDSVLDTDSDHPPYAGAALTDASPLVVPEIVEPNEKRGELTAPRHKLSSNELFNLFLGGRPHLDLTDKIFVEKNGGYADVFEGHIITTNVKVAVKRLRLNILGEEKKVKARQLERGFYFHLTQFDSEYCERDQILVRSPTSKCSPPSRIPNGRRLSITDL